MSFPWMLLSLKPYYTKINIKITHHDSLQKTRIVLRDAAPTASCVFKASMGKMSLFTASNTRGSLTAETAFVLPIFLFFMLTICAFFDVMQKQNDLLDGLHNNVKQAAVWAYETPMEKDLIELKMDYQAKPRITFFTTQPLSGYVHVSARAWTGADDSFGTGAGEGEVAYRTINGTVYHTNPNCSYLNPSVRNVSKQQLSTIRNMQGEIYRACEICDVRTYGAIYITEYGNRYHKDISCSGLKRTILVIPRSDAELQYSFCTKCAVWEAVK